MRKLLLSFFAIAVAVAIAYVALPFWVIQPMRAQAAGAFMRSLHMKQQAPLVTAIALAVAALLGVILWARARRPTKFALLFGLLLSASAAALSRVNYFEWYFHPNPAPAFVAASQAHLDRGDMVLAIRINGLARAYPIRTMAYHHVINDTVNGVPVVATY